MPKSGPCVLPRTTSEIILLRCGAKHMYDHVRTIHDYEGHTSDSPFAVETLGKLCPFLIEHAKSDTVQ